MDLLYQEHFGFKQRPFNITPDPSFLYQSDSHKEALAQLSYGISARKGFIVLTGEVGTGKTTLIKALLNSLNGKTQTALVFSVITTPIDLLRYVCDDFGLTDPRNAFTDIHDYLVLLNNFLLDKYGSGENCALIIDEAQNLPSEVLESIRLLSNFETAKNKLLQILLVGQPELSARLNSYELRQLRQRVALRHHLDSLTSKECKEYMVNRLVIANGDPNIFTPEALDAVYAYSKGIPRVMNVLGDNALLTAYALGKKHVDGAIITEVAEDLSLSNGIANVRPSSPLITHRSNGSRPNSNGMGLEVAEPPIASQPGRRAASVNHPATRSLDDRVTERFFQALRDELVDAMGPMGKIVIQDNIRRLGLSANDFPKNKLAALIESISNEILDVALKQRFLNRISNFFSDFTVARVGRPITR
ncbi:MAG: ral secretion pathway protein [Candidatus Binatota bacterium]|nr:ral secretion pathway protein [Candidatus Binatota bacterium]